MKREVSGHTLRISKANTTINVSLGAASREHLSPEDSWMLETSDLGIRVIVLSI